MNIDYKPLITHKNFTYFDMPRYKHFLETLSFKRILVIKVSIKLNKIFTLIKTVTMTIEVQLKTAVYALYKPCQFN